METRFYSTPNPQNGPESEHLWSQRCPGEGRGGVVEVVWFESNSGDLRQQDCRQRSCGDHQCTLFIRRLLDDSMSRKPSQKHASKPILLEQASIVRVQSAQDHLQSTQGSRDMNTGAQEPGLRPVLGASGGACGADHEQRMPLQGASSAEHCLQRHSLCDVQLRARCGACERQHVGHRSAGAA